MTKRRQKRKQKRKRKTSWNRLRTKSDLRRRVRNRQGAHLFICSMISAGFLKGEKSGKFIEKVVTQIVKNLEVSYIGDKRGSFSQSFL